MEPFRAADIVAQELQTPGLAQQAMQEIRNDVFQMTPHQALQFERRLNQDLGGHSPLHERQEVVQTPRGLMPTGHLELTMTDPYGHQMPIKHIDRRECYNEAPPVVVRPGYGPGYGPGYVPQLAQPGIGVRARIPLGRNGGISIGGFIP